MLSGGFPGGHPLSGIGPGFVPQVLNTYILDEVIKVKTPDSLKLMADLARLEGLMCGISSGTNVAAAIQLAKKLGDMGDKTAYEQVMLAVSDFEKGNLRLSTILAAMQ